MMGDWWDDGDVPASCEVQVEVVSEVSVKNLNVDVDKSEYGCLPIMSEVTRFSQ